MISIIMRPVAGFACAVQLKDGSDGLPNLFIFPGLGGTVSALAQLCSLIAVPSRIYAFQSQGVDGTVPPDRRVEDMASRYLAELTRLQPNGPYLLCGHSFGGLVAFEAAQRLRASGAEIAALILLDTGIHQSFWPRRYFAAVLLRRLRHHLSVILALPLKEMLGYAARTARMLVHRVRTYLRVTDLSAGIDEDEMTPALKEIRNCERVAAADYCPGFYPGKIIYISSAIPGPATFDPNVLWRGRAQELEVRIVAGGHRSMLDQPYVSDLGSTLAEYLRPFCVGRVTEPL